MSILLSASQHTIVDHSGGGGPIMAVRIQPTANITTIRRDFHIALLIDTSGSMSGERMDTVKKTLHVLVDHLDKNDALTLIRYDSTAKLLTEHAQIQDNKDSLHKCIDCLDAFGCTNLESAFIQLRHVTERHPVDAVFILTDGYINKGILVTHELIKNVYSFLNPDVPVHTLGYGASHNIQLLRDIALHSRGSYTFADSNEIIPAIIGDIVGGLATEIGRSGRLQIPVGWTCLEVGFQQSDTEYHVGTLIDQKDHWVLLAPAVATATATSTHTPIDTLQFTWKSKTTKYIETCVPTTTISMDECLEQYYRIHVAKCFTRIATLLESGQYETARRHITELKIELESSSIAYRPIMANLQSQMSHYLSMIPEENERIEFNTVPGRHLLSVDTSVMPVLSRIVSNTTTLGNQRGFITESSYSDYTVEIPTTHVRHTFSSPIQHRHATQMTTNFSQLH